MSGINSRNSTGLRLLSDANLENPYITGNITGFSGNNEITGFKSAEIDKISNENGALEVNKVSSTEPLSTNLVDGEANLSLSIDETRLQVSPEGNLTAVDVNVDSPLQYSTEQHLVSLNYDNTFDSPLFINDDGEVELRYSSHFQDNEGGFEDGTLFEKGLELKIAPPFEFNSFNSHKLSLKYDSDTLDIDNGELTVKDRNYEHPLYRDDDTIGVQLKPPLGVSENGLTLFTTNPFDVNDDGHLMLKIGSNLKIRDGELNAKDVDSLLKGAGAISVYRDPLESLEGAIVKLDVDHENFQQTGTKLSFRSTGLGQIPFDNGIAGLNRTSDFTFSETLNEPHVPHVILSQNFTPDSDEAVTTSYVDQLYQAGSGVDISAKVNSRREISIRTDASLSIDINNNLSVNPSAFINNQSIRVNSEGKLTSGLLFQSMDSLGIRNGNEVFLDLHTQGNLDFDGEVLTDTRTFGNGLHENSSHEVELDLTVSGALEMNSTKTNITENLTANNGVTREGNNFRGAYVAGNNISITGATISCTYQPDEPEIEEPLVGGTGITVVGRTISNTMTLTAGTGVILVGSPGLGYTISSISESSLIEIMVKGKKTASTSD
ncbi:hypothetical protein DFS34DRAFT_691113 [Phlyctochytrium arcticum]|nr:hypothetical protein DFS34DRAFT_691113 [Phlyctochytrium arcticum]